MAEQILVVEDEPDVREFLRFVLASIGYRVDTAGEGAEALTRLEGTAYDLIVSDVKMPGVDGQALYREAIRRWPCLRDRFAFLTGDMLGLTTEEFLSGEGLPVLEKPFTAGQLRDFVRSRLDGRCS
ncbi:MAG: response regulator [Deltaproteobacteria bacterium]|nr:response regulator [Deltaproteobacteria bacterium]